MEQISISSHLRPPRVTFIISNSYEFKKAISYSTISWGGILFTIVDIKNTYLNNLIEIYKPDFIVPLFDDKSLPDLGTKYNNRKMREDLLLTTSSHTTEYKFLDTLPIYKSLFNKKISSDIAEITNTNNLKLIDCFFFGYFQNSFFKKYYAHYKSLINNNSNIIKSIDRLKFQNKKIITPIISTMLMGKRRFKNKKFYNEIHILIGSESNRKDIEILWNLRALGENIYFIDKNSLKRELTNLKNNKYINKALNSKNFRYRFILLSFDKKNMKKEYLNEFKERISKNAFYITVEDYFNDDNTSNHISIELLKTYKSGLFHNNKITFDFERPQNLNDRNIHQTVGICFDLPSSYKNPNQLINSVPNVNTPDKYLFLHNSNFLRPYIFDNNTITHFDSTFSQTEHCWINTPVEFWRRFFKEKNLIYTTSLPGKNLETIISRNFHNDIYISSRFLKLKSTRELLFQLNNNKSITHKKAQNIVSTYWPNYKSESEFHEYDKTNILKKLIKNKVLRQGYRLKCENCQNDSFYSIKYIGNYWECKFCYEKQVTPCLKNQNLAYKSDGIFQLKNQGGGLITSLLTLWFFHELNTLRELNYLSSFTLSKSNKDGKESELVECDTLLMVENKVVLIESKTKNDLEDSDLKKMKTIANLIECEVYFCYSNLKEDFNKHEIELIHKYHQNEINNIILLSAKELDTYSITNLKNGDCISSLEDLAKYSYDKYLNN